MKNSNLKLNRAVNFRTNEDLYYNFALKCKLKKQKIGDRLNALITADLECDIPIYTVIEEPKLFDKQEIPSTPEEASSDVA